ncbi:MAG: hypothetical protein K8E66_05275, partial [Phycisphaerales bacterium]|nr:hypothetical protein [Phycisphaerales bacterium]
MSTPRIPSSAIAITVSKKILSPDLRGATSGKRACMCGAIREFAAARLVTGRALDSGPTESVIRPRADSTNLRSSAGASSSELYTRSTPSGPVARICVVVSPFTVLRVTDTRREDTSDSTNDDSGMLTRPPLLAADSI